jgi:hypothetical protein
MALVNFTNLDFDQIKSSIREYLRSNSNFTDYDFEGSNLSTIIDLLAYNTYISSYNANMISNEVFIDSATLRENVVSLAKHIGYTPRSRTSSRANISFFVDTTSISTAETAPLTVTLQKGLVCVSSVASNGQNYTFSIIEDITVPVVNGIALFDNITIYEGSYVNQSFIVDVNNSEQKFILNNANIDTSTLSVNIRNSQESSIINKFNLCEDLCVVNDKSRVFFLQEIEDQRYEIIFGDGIFGKKLDNSNVVEVTYIVSNGESSNGIESFSFIGRLVDNNARVIASGVSLISTISPSQGGKEIESIDSIRKYAPRLYSSQKRAVTSSDYENIVTMLYPEAESVSVFGGEELDPPRYGKVFITIKPFEGEVLPETIKDNLKNLLRKYSVAGIVTEILDLKYLYIEFDSSVYYNTSFSQSPSDLKTQILNNLIRYSDSTELNKYGARFKYSKFLKIIDETNKAITSNITKINMRRDLKVLLNQFAEYEICFGNGFHIKNESGYNIKSSSFGVSGILEDLYLSDIPDSNKKTGRIIFFKINIENSLPYIVNPNAGKIDYEKGEVIIYPVNIIRAGKEKFNNPIIEISAIPKSNDIIGLQDLYLQLDINNSIINMISDPISSGSDISGTIYKTTSSYSNGNFIRK